MDMEQGGEDLSLLSPSRSPSASSSNSSSNFDVEAFLAPYSASCEAMVYRLHYIAVARRGSAVAACRGGMDEEGHEEASYYALPALQNAGPSSADAGGDDGRLRAACADQARTLLRGGPARACDLRMAAALGMASGSDASWIARETEWQRARGVELEAAVQKAQMSSAVGGQKDALMLAVLELGEFQYGTGYYQKAAQTFMRAWNHGSSPAHLKQICWNIARALLRCGDHRAVISYLARFESLLSAADKNKQTQHEALLGYVNMLLGSYEHAAARFLNTAVDAVAPMAAILCPRDIATYCVLCAIAGLPREQIRDRLVQGRAFRVFLDHAPDSRSLVRDLYHCRYADVLRTLERVQRDLSYDAAVHRVLLALLAVVRERVLVQYCTPFSVADLRIMARAFEMDLAVLERRLCGMIRAGKISARIDSEHGLLVARNASSRASSYRRVLAASEQTEEETRHLLLRSSLMRLGAVVGGPEIRSHVLKTSSSALFAAPPPIVDPTDGK